MSLARAERRALVERLLVEDHERSNRSIARASTASHTLVGQIRVELEGAGKIAARSASVNVATQDGHGNLVRQAAGVPSPATRHGAYSEASLAPLRDRFEGSLRDEYGELLDDRRLFLLADLLSRIELGLRWLDQRGGVVRNRSGEVFAVADRVETWSRRATLELKELQELKRAAGEVDPQAALAAHLARLNGGDS